MFSIHRILFLALKKAWTVKITPPQVLTPPGKKIPPCKISNPPNLCHYLVNPARGEGRGDESRELHRVHGAGESSASTTADTNTSFATLPTTKQTTVEIWGSKTYRDSQ